METRRWSGHMCAELLLLFFFFSFCFATVADIMNGTAGEDVFTLDQCKIMKRISTVIPSRLSSKNMLSLFL